MTSLLTSSSGASSSTEESSLDLGPPTPASLPWRRPSPGGQKEEAGLQPAAVDPPPGKLRPLGAGSCTNRPGMRTDQPTVQVQRRADSEEGHWVGEEQVSRPPLRPRASSCRHQLVFQVAKDDETGLNPPGLQA